jgi:hypothetical protein
MFVSGNSAVLDSVVGLAQTSSGCIDPLDIFAAASCNVMLSSEGKSSFCSVICVAESSFSGTLQIKDCVESLSVSTGWKQKR